MKAKFKSPKEKLAEIKRLQRLKEKAIHANIFQSRGKYEVYIFDQKGTIRENSFATHQQARDFLAKYSRENGKENRKKYNYGTIADIATLPYRLEIFTNEIKKKKSSPKTYTKTHSNPIAAKNHAEKIKKRGGTVKRTVKGKSVVLQYHF